MEKLIGIVIPADLKKEITDFTTHYGVAFDPYIELIGNDMIKDARGVDRNLQSFCLSQPSFKTIIGGPNIEKNDGGQVFFLTVMMGGLNTVRENIRKHLKLSPFNGVFRPYLSLLGQKNGDGKNYDFDEMMSEAKLIFSKPRTISVESLGIYSHKDAGAPFTLENAYPFTGR